MKRLTVKKKLFWAIIIFWMSFIGYLSHQPAPQSNEFSKDVTHKIVQIQDKVALDNKLGIDIKNGGIRNNAHFIVYMILGILVMNVIREKRLKHVGMALILCILFAGFDEIHQIFVPGRSAEVRDILMDTAGAGTGIFISLVGMKLLRQTGEKKDNNDE